MDPYLGEIRIFAGNYAPSEWLFCAGQILNISDYAALYSLLGTTYGGNGTTTFGLPDLRGRSPANAGQGPGLSNYILGQVAGTESINLTGNQIGAHSHPLLASSKLGALSTPASNTAIAQPTGDSLSLFGVAPGNTTLSSNAIGASGSSLPHENRQPFLTINYIISYA